MLPMIAMPELPFRRNLMTDEIILHQYWQSPFTEKVRVVLGMKGLAWRSVEQPSIMPKPELTPLTGGYRRIPVMQIGADIYCDSQVILRELERRYPGPYPRLAACTPPSASGRTRSSSVPRLP
jgi:glutathione S-transferase